MKSKLLRRITVAIVAAALLTTTIAATFAVFTNDSQTNIAVNGANVEVVATLEDLELYSPSKIDFDGQVINSDNAATSKEFANGGTASIEEGTLTLSEIAAGDKATFNIKITNNSSIVVKYRTVLTVAQNDGLFDGLVVNIGSTYNGNELSTEWKTLEVGSAEEVIACSVELPATADKTFMKKTCAISFKVEAVQSNIYILEGATNISELKTEIANGKGDSADNPLTIIGGEWGALGDFVGNSAIEDCHLIINDGKFNEFAIFPYARGSVVTINGGSFKGTYLGFHVDGSIDQDGIITQAGIIININGGEFDIDYFVYADSTVWTVRITGGTFSIDPTQYVVEGYTAQENVDGTWTVVKNS